MNKLYAILLCGIFAVSVMRADEMITYSNVGNLNYLELEQHRLHHGIKPRSVHFPLNLPYQQGLIFSDCAFNVYYLPVPPDLNAKEIKTWQQVGNINLQMVSFFFDEAPFMADFRQTSWSRIGGRYPMSKGELLTWQLKYTLEYCVDPSSGITYVRVTVLNTSDTALDAVVRMLASKPKEVTVFDYHYCPYRWDNSRFAQLIPAENIPEVVSNDGFIVKLNDEFSYKPEDFNTRFGCSRPYVAGPEMQIREGTNFVKFSRKLDPGASASFTIAIRFEGSNAQAAAAGDFDAVCAGVAAYWDRISGGTVASFGSDSLTDTFYAVQWNNLQLLLELESARLGGRVCQPCQGGSSERFFVWTWEAVEAMRPMIRLGYFDAVKKVLDFIFRLQDGGFPPEGDFTSLAGAIGTTGPRWANTTGAALMLAVEYAMISGDREFIREYTPKIILAARWILGEVKATQKYNPDGSKAVGFGVMPVAVASDGDRGRILTMTDVVSLQGVLAAAKFLESINAPEYAEIASGAEEYRQNLLAAIASLARGDGYISRRIPSDGENIALSFERAFGGGLAYLEVFDPRDPVFASVIPYTERTRFSGRFCSPLFDRIHYIGNTELQMFKNYLKLGEWKKALLAAGTFRSCAMTPDLYLLQERYSEVSDVFTPWQPNASNNGRYLELLISGLYFEDRDDQFILAGGIAPAEFASGGEFSLNPLHTVGGKVQFSIKNGVLSVKRDNAFVKGTRFRLPEYFRFEPDGNFIKALPDNTFELLQDANEFSGRITLHNLF